MALKTKSVRASPAAEDGLRICIMRRYNREKHPEFAEVDEHWPDLAPSSTLLGESREGLSWEQYVRRFTAEVLVQKAQTVRELAALAKEKDVTILCHETEPAYCHRRLVALACRMHEPELSIKIR